MSEIVEYKNIQHFCRICFEVKSDLVSSFTKLFIGDESCTINDILKLFIKEVIFFSVL